MRAHEFLTENYDPDQSYRLSKIPEIKFLPLDIIRIREYDHLPEVTSVDDETAQNMDFSQPIQVTAFRYDKKDNSSNPEVILDDGHHRYAAALQTGRKFLPVKVSAMNATGTKINNLIKISNEIEMNTITESWKEIATNASIIGALATAGLGGAYMQGKLDNQNVEQPTKQEIQTQKQEQPTLKRKTIPLLTKSQNEYILVKTAVAHGLRGTELAAFMSQCAHESRNFKDLVERTWGNPDKFKLYEPNTKTGKILGNKYKGDGAYFKGRGFLQITGRYNYEKAEKETGIPLSKNPKLAADPQHAAELAVWFWKMRVKPNVSDFSNVDAVTRKINPKMIGLDDRKRKFEKYEQAYRT